MEIFKWLKNEVRNINNILDLGILISISIGFAYIMIFFLKYGYMNTLGIPLKMIFNIVDFKIMDFILVYFLLSVFLILFYIINKIKTKKIIMFLISVFFISVISCVCEQLDIFFIYLQGISMSLFLLIILIKVIYILNKKHLEDGRKILNKIFNDKKHIPKIIISIFEINIILLGIALIFIGFGSTLAIFPGDKQEIDNKVILVSSNDGYLTSNIISIKDNIIQFDKNEFELISRDSDNIKIKNIKDSKFKI
ncbi:hypothetical protein [Clostridium sp. Ade.TY]|uniref:hypothetical protein n=1 Tax=Clostridium sp. Ade.TY TaxID=1391647 RepID=UPI00040BD8A6|nr:hypothetical protein [Clostridium sp. Ade.TY]